MFLRGGEAVCVMPSAAQLNLHRPDPGQVRIADIADVLARRVADPFIRDGFYSLAQRSVIIAHKAALLDGTLVGLHALLALAPAAIVDWPIVVDLPIAFAEHARAAAELAVAICDALDLDPPSPAVTALIAELLQRLHMSELICLRSGVSAEIEALRARGTRPLVGHIAPQNWPAARDAFVKSFRTFAAQAGLRQTTAWFGLN